MGFASRVNSLTNAITANAKSFEHGLEKATGVAMTWKAEASADREAIKTLRDSMVADLNKNIVRAIQLGEARAKAVQERAMENIATEKKALLTTISSSVENMADNIFKAVQEGRHKIADDFLPLLFSGKEVKVDNAISKINGLVNEYIETMGMV